MLWHGLTHTKKSEYDDKTTGKPYSGYNLFISNHIKDKAIRLYNSIAKLMKRDPYIEKLNTVYPLCLKAVCFDSKGRELLLIKNPPGELAEAS